MLGQSAHIGGNGHLVVIDDYDHFGLGGAGIVQRFKSHSAGQRPVANHRNHLIVFFVHVTGFCNTQCYRNGIAAVAGVIHVRRTFRSFRETAEAAVLAQRIKLPGTAGQDLVNIGLVSHVPKDSILRHVKNSMQGQCKLHDAQIGSEMSSGLRDLFDQEFPDLFRQFFHLIYCHRFQFFRKIIFK